MARHRNVRTMNYEDECYDDDDYLGHSVEDNYCISPGTAAQFTFNREKDFDLSTYMGNERIPEEEEGFDSDTDPSSLNDSHGYKKPNLSDTDQGKLNSCLEEIRNILGDSTPDHVLCQTIIKNKYDLQASLNELLKSDEAPKPQRQPRQSRRNRSQGDDNVEDDLDSFMESLESESPQKTHFLSNQNKSLGILKFGKLSPSVDSPINTDVQTNKTDNATSESGDSSIFTKDVKFGASDTSPRVLVKPKQPKDTVSLPGETEVGRLSLSNLAKQHSVSAVGHGVSLASLAKPSVKGQQKLGNKELSHSENIAQRTKASPQVGGITVSEQQHKDRPSLTSSQAADGFQYGSKSELKSGTKRPVGLSLTDLIKQNRMDNKGDVVAKDTSHASRVSLADLAGQRSQSNVSNMTGGKSTKVSLSDLASKSSGTAAQSLGQTSNKHGKSLADLASQHKASIVGTDCIPAKSKASATETVIGQLSGLSLADLAKSHKTQPQKGPTTASKSLRDLAHQQLKSAKTSSDKQCVEESRMLLSDSEQAQPVSLGQKTSDRIDENILSQKFSGLMNANVDIDYYLENDADFTNRVKMVSPSVLAKSISSSFVYSKRNGTKKRLRFPKFSYQVQMSTVKENLTKVNENIVPFDFSTPSPDDIVKKKQNLAFTRTGR
ncbi:uncharacterized protein LOC132560482 isoform X2 [Ylistrum balloti]|uniref:uncharacterized protein LOC132560482 isoform X2 n=1 Tax=Ylistrum balloti TaxID=509963 RepID=UPI002905F078|nr:uncharacterized protein LOC132560482 isoform X2 [Ylistrum balloti]